jgi:hypothetical protein
MMRSFFLFILIACYFSPAFAEDGNGAPQASLFFTPQEAHEAEVLAQRLAPAGVGDIRLGAVMYYGPDDWTLWLQGEKWTPETSRDDLRVLEVTEDAVRLWWRNEDDATEHEITLRPNESFQIATGKIISEP